MADMKARGPLGDLINEIRKLNGWSEKDVADRAVRKLGPGAISKQTVNRLSTEYPLKMAPRRTIIALATGLGLSPDRVALEAFRSMEFRPPVQDMSTAEVVQRDPDLSEHTRAAILAILRSASDRSA